MERIVRSLVAQNSLISTRLAALEKLVVSGGLNIGTVADPGPDGGGFGGGFVGGGIIGGIDPVADPSPEELGKLSKVQIESRLADIGFMRTKLDSLEGLLKERL